MAGRNKKTPEQHRMRVRGLAEALETVAATIGAPADAPRAEQLPLIPSRGAAARDPGNEIARTGQPGRPKGATSDATKAWAAFLQRQYGSPLQGMAEIAFRPTLALALELGCEPLEALKVQLTAMDKLAPYMHSKMPVAIELDQLNAAPLIFNVSPEMAAVMAGQAKAARLEGSFRVINQDQAKSTTYTDPPADVGR